ncbi:hypothetical protein MKW94_015378, partial [Papaver nudicaule]|nr:hypothetical protein [Papaver nudicaule]
MTKEEEIENDGDDMMMIDGKEQRRFPLKQECDPDYLKSYYVHLFPYADIYKWLSYGNGISFVLGNDVYLPVFFFFIEKLTCGNILEDCCCLKLKHFPQPAKRNAYTGENAFTPVEKELVFDVDMSDYDDVRYCCSGANVCKNCWPLMTIAIKVIDSTLREDFKFTHILWVYSGRRGVHCWVCDERARRWCKFIQILNCFQNSPLFKRFICTIYPCSLNNPQRAAIADYIHVYKGNENSRKKVFLGTVLHPSLERSYEQVLRPFFEKELLCGQNLLETEEKFEKILEMIPDE